MQFNVSQREITLKVVYYGPPFSGKTTNLQALHGSLLPGARGRLTVLNTADDRTLFFDLLPVVVASRSGYRIKLKLFTVPGQVIHAATRRVVLAGADGVIFVADSQLSEARRNNEFWHGMRHYMTKTGINPNTVPTVIQLNKRDLPDIRSDEEVAQLQKKSREPLYLAAAVRNEGVRETLHGLLQLLFDKLNTKHHFQAKFQISADEFSAALFGDAGVGESPSSAPPSPAPPSGHDQPRAPR